MKGSCEGQIVFANLAHCYTNSLLVENPTFSAALLDALVLSFGEVIISSCVDKVLAHTNHRNFGPSNCLGNLKNKASTFLVKIDDGLFR